MIRKNELRAFRVKNNIAAPAGTEHIKIGRVM
jgi:hypothetical protein